jgi:hypothetical protein
LLLLAFWFCSEIYEVQTPSACCLDLLRPRRNRFAPVSFKDRSAVADVPSTPLMPTSSGEVKEREAEDAEEAQAQEP